MKPKQLFNLLLVCLVLFTGCLVGKQYTQPPEPTGISYRENVTTDTSQLITWFDLYQDTALRTMIRTTLDSNRDLMTAAARIEEARFQTAVIKANLYPQFGYSAQAGGGQSGTEAQKTGSGVDGGLFNVFGALSWELDVWGKVRHANRAAVAEYLATVQNRNALEVSLVAETASEYFLLRDLDNRLAIAQQTLTSRQQYTQIITEV